MLHFELYLIQGESFELSLITEYVPNVILEMFLRQA
jgi:hypothetical protein